MFSLHSLLHQQIIHYANQRSKIFSRLLPAPQNFMNGNEFEAQVAFLDNDKNKMEKCQNVS